jgi:hypothetical protein
MVRFFYTFAVWNLQIRPACATSSITCYRRCDCFRHRPLSLPQSRSTVAILAAHRPRVTVT